MLRPGELIDTWDAVDEAAELVGSIERRARSLVAGWNGAHEVVQRGKWFPDCYPGHGLLSAP
jgi:hypothetical protein